MANYLQPAGSRPSSYDTTEISRNDLVHIDDMYKTRIYNRSIAAGQVIDITGYVPQDFSLDAGSSWDSPFAETFSNMAQRGGAALGGQGGAYIGDMFSRVTGVRNVAYASARTWSSSNYFSFNLPLKIAAYNDTLTEVLEPLKRVLKLVVPDVGVGDLLLPPGPDGVAILKKAASSFSASKATAGNGHVSYDPTTWARSLEESLAGEAFTLQIGKFFKVFPAIVTSVNARFEPTFEHGSGRPLFVELDLAVESYMTPTRQDIDNWILTE